MRSEILYRGAATIGSFRCAPGDPQFRDSGPARGHLLVFPREPVVIRHAGGAPVVADRSVVMVYNQHQAYTRAALTPAGDRCEWFRFDAATILDAREAYAPSDAEMRPFGELVRVRSNAETYLLARRVVSRVASAEPSWLDEMCATLLDHALRDAFGPPAAISTAHRVLAEAARRSIAQHFTRAWSVGELATSLGTSTFHLCRVFRTVTGSSLHAYRTELRVRAAVERILAGEPLAPLALDLGFSSHSHFTQAFRAAFRISPSRLRASKISTARRR